MVYTKNIDLCPTMSKIKRDIEVIPTDLDQFITVYQIEVNNISNTARLPKEIYNIVNIRKFYTRNYIIGKKILNIRNLQKIENTIHRNCNYLCPILNNFNILDTLLSMPKMERCVMGYFVNKFEFDKYVKSSILLKNFQIQYYQSVHFLAAYYISINRILV